MSYVSICAVYNVTVGGWPKGNPGVSNACAVQRVKVTAGTTYSGIANSAGFDSTYTYGTGTKIYNNHSSLGNIPSSVSAITVYSDSHGGVGLSNVHYAVYVDDGSGTVYTDSTVRAKYTELTGSSIPA